jgi:hypothetical protein
MTGPPFDQRDPRDLAGDDPVIRELEAYSGLTAGEQPHGITERVMAVIAEEPTPRRGFLAGLLGTLEGGRGGGMMRIAMVTATMALAVLAVVLAGQLAELFREPQIGPSPLPSSIESTPPSVSEPPSPSPTPSESPTTRPSRTPRPSPTDDESPEATASPDDDDNSGPGGGGDDESETPEPSDDDNSGPGGGGGDDDDNSGPGGGGDGSGRGDDSA